LDAAASNLCCIQTGKKVMAWYFHAPCKGCFGQKNSEEEEKPIRNQIANGFAAVVVGWMQQPAIITASTQERG
jgi:hypothetical protein